MPADARDTVARQQRELIDALAGGACPDGFDHKQLDTAARSLAKKRLRIAQKSWPVLHAALGERYEELFSKYAAATPLSDATPDARRFLRYLLHELRDNDLNLQLCPVRASIGWPIRFTINTAGVAVAVRLLHGIWTWIKPWRRHPR